MASRFSLHTNPISGAGVTLLPSHKSHAAELRVAAHDDSTFRYFSRGPTPFDEGGFATYIDSFRDDESVRMFTVRDDTSGSFVGMTSFLEISPTQRSLEIGWTWYSPEWRSGYINPACKLVLLDLAFEGGLFDGLGAVRVQLRTDELNARSRRAILKLGAQFEGTLRNQVLMPDGGLCARSMYSILPQEWGSVRSGLETRLKSITNARRK